MNSPAKKFAVVNNLDHTFIKEDLTTLESAIQFAEKAYLKDFNSKSVCQLDLDADRDGSMAWVVVKRICYVEVWYTREG